MAQTFNLPDVGEGLTEAEIVSWKVQPGQSVSVNDILVEIETAKSLVELPSPFEGTVGKLLVDEGVTVDVGTAIITVDAAGEESGEVPTEPANDADGTPAEGPLVGSGPRADAVKRRARRRPGQQPAPRTTPSPRPQDPPKPPTPRTPEEPPAEQPADSSSLGRFVHRVLAKPPVRKIAKDLGVDLSQVSPSGASGEVTREDLMSHAQRDTATKTAPKPDAPTSATTDVEVVPVRGVRKVTAAAMVQSAFTAPHVSIFKEVDATRTMEYVKRLKTSPAYEGVKVSPLLVVSRAVVWAAQRNPQVNASWVSGPDGDEIHLMRAVNLGIAAATPRGLMVPNIKGAQSLSLRELASGLETLTTTAREGRTPPSDMQGGTLTITNIGALGVDIGTPILNPGEVAILAFGTVKQKPWMVDGEVLPRWITTLGGSFDHRVVDGDLAARFMNDVAAILEEPALLVE